MRLAYEFVNTIKEGTAREGATTNLDLTECLVLIERDRGVEEEVVVAREIQAPLLEEEVNVAEELLAVTEGV